MTWNWKTPSLAQRLLAGLLIISAASAFRMLFFSGLGRGIPYLLYYPATMLAALYGGLATGFLATALSSLLVFFWVQQGKLSPPEWLGFLIFVASCLAISIVCETLRRTRKKIEDVNRNLQREIIERKHASEVLTTSELRYRRLFESAQDGILILDAETGMIVDVNPFLIDLLGYSRETFLNEKVWELGFLKDVVANEDKFAELRDKEYIRYENLALEGRDGKRHEVEFISNVYLVDHHKVIQCNIRDISERKQAEEVKNRMAAIVECSEDAIIGKDLDGDIITWNQGAEKIFGWTAAEMEGTSIRRLIPADRQAEEDHIMETIRRGETIAHFETVRLTKAGRRLDVSITASPIRNAAGKIIGFSKVARDITERVKAVAEINSLNAKLEQRIHDRTVQLEAANKELEAFSYSVSHDLRAPLRHVQGYVDMLGREAEGRLSAQGRHYMKTIADASREMGVLIDDLLAFSRMGRADMIETRVNLDTMVQDALRILEPSMRERNIVWKIPPLPAVQADPAMLKLALANLLGNAVKFTRPRDPAQVEMGTAGTEDGRVIFFVRDNGVGFDPQYGHKLFGVFQRLHRTDQFEGTGIGLANVRRIITRHGGRIWAEGKLNEGATFYFTLKTAQ